VRVRVRVRVCVPVPGAVPAGIGPVHVLAMMCALVG